MGDIKLFSLHNDSKSAYPTINFMGTGTLSTIKEPKESVITLSTEGSLFP
ncbi:hypothetical protein SAMN05216353_10463 [Halobacillus alkaliphilus]|uniref:Uncharacterized protein n=1 Tax=Halobacillus alkaliphilus TaxID=396056 RepID=A0A1I2KE62_9BACI|nr:hypothetical protein SAMN05216353_10463 [Halobacillus alkaliphilus]